MLLLSQLSVPRIQFYLMFDYRYNQVILQSDFQRTLDVMRSAIRDCGPPGKPLVFQVSFFHLYIRSISIYDVFIMYQALLQILVMHSFNVI